MATSESESNVATDVLSPLLTATGASPLTNGRYPSSDVCQSPTRHGNGFDLSDQFSPTPDVFEIRNDNRSLKTKLRQIHAELKSEQDTVCNLRRRINTMERERIDVVSSVNQEVARLDGEVTRYRAQLEKSEALRQSLEFELTKAQREINSEKRSGRDKETALYTSNDTMKQKISDLGNQVEHLTSEMEANKSSASENNSRLQSIILEKEQIISSTQTERDVYEAEKLKLEAILEQQDTTITEMDEKIQELEDDKRAQLESLHRHIGENELFVEKEKRLKLDLETAGDKIKSLEENIEAERAAHLETKFNSEIVQLRIRDLEGALDIEKKAKTDVIGTTDKLKKQLRSEKEYSYVNKHLHNELEEKKRLIKKLSEQLDVHQKEFTELKQELNKAKKKQIVLEECFNGSTKEMQILVDNFRAGPQNKKAKKSSNTRKESSKTQLLSSLLEDMRGVLIDLKRRSEESIGDNTRLKQHNENLVDECAQYKEMIFSKDKTIQTTQQNFTRTSKDLRKLQMEWKERDPIVKQLQQELNEAKQLLEKERKQTIHLNEHVSQVANRYKTDEQTSAEFLHSLYRQLQIVHHIPKSQEVAVQSWGDLAIAVNAQVGAMINATAKMEEKIKHLELAVKEKDDTQLSMQKSHEEQLEKIASIAENRSHQWHQQKADMEKHYSQLLADIHGRHKKTQSLADQAWEKIRISGTVQQGLESECSQLRSDLSDCRKEHDTLLTACTLLTSAFYPLYSRNVALSAERQILAEQVSKFDAFKQEVHVLVDALSVDQEIRKPARGRRLRVNNPLLRFRAVAIAVMGANRLIHGLHNKSAMFTVNDVLPGMYSMSVCTGGLDPRDKPFTGASNPFILEDEKVTCRPEDYALSWLGSTDFLSTILATVGDLQSALEKARAGERGYDTKKLINVTKNTFRKMICLLPSNFPCLTTEPYNGLREKSSLIRFLAHGLNRALAHTSLKGQSNLMCSQNTVGALQTHILEFTERLHNAEVERRDLRVEVNRLNQHIQSFEESSDVAQMLRVEVKQLRSGLDSMVPCEKFETVCQELNHALRREQEAQRLLNEQSHQIHDIGLQLEVRSSESTDKTTDLRNTLKREQQAQMVLSDQNKQISSLRGKLGSLKLKLDEKERKLTDEAEACHSLISKYVTNEKQLANKVSLMNDEIHQQKEHITTLKRELAAACKREFDDEISSLKLVADHQISLKNDTPSRSAFWHSTTREGDFVPLREEDETLPTKMTPTYRRAHSQHLLTPDYRTPQQSQNTALHRKAGKGK